MQTNHLISARRPDLVIISKKKKRKKKKKRTRRIVDLAVPADHRVEFKESEKEKYLNYARDWIKKPWNMKVTVIPIVIGGLGTVTNGLVEGPEDLEAKRSVETIQTTALLRSVRILRRVLEIWGDLLSLKLQ